MPAKKGPAKEGTVKKGPAKEGTVKKVPARKPRTSKSKKQTHIALVIDRSGSMSSVRAETFAGINLQLATIKENVAKTGETFVTYIQFDDVIETVLSRVNAKDIVPIREDQYQPRGWTAFNDALGKAVTDLKRDVIETTDTAYLVIVVTDGFENASKEYTSATITELVKTLTNTGRWEFVYVMANLSVQQQADFRRNYSVRTNSMLTYVPDSGGVISSNEILSTSLNTYSTSRSTGNMTSDKFFDPTTKTTP